MKNKLLYLIAFIFFGLTFNSCSKNDDDKGAEIDFDYPQEYLLGTWESTEISLDNVKYYDITNEYSYYDTFKFTLTLSAGGKYSTNGYFGNGKGTYHAEGKTIKFYLNGTKYMYTIRVLAMTNSQAKILVTVDGSGSNLYFNVKKKYY
jgi:hypothetical protein